MSEKTEEATPTRLQRARDDGDAGVSVFASQAVAFLVAATLVPSAGAAAAKRAEELLKTAIAHVGARPAAFDTASIGREVLVLVLPLLGAVALTSAAVSALQAGFAFSTKKLAPDLTRLDPIQGFVRLFSLARLFSVARALVGAGFVGWVVWHILHDRAADFGRTAGSLAAAATLSRMSAVTLARDAALVGLGMAILDRIVTGHSWRARLRMGKDEVKRERKESDGDPQVKAARERARHELLASATIANVKTASVVIVNPTHVACALRYEEKDGDSAPVVVATGHGDLAKRIVDAAHAYGVPVLADIPLARALAALEVGDVIPEALYEAVAEILHAAREGDP